ncbi:3-oxosteroid 1-dehydrogenase [Nocardia puris]|uniref:3-oxosteroid 1-dehydrogenase n=1 Tax=Nocardia puris TaxID=208602 RepID=A0A366DUI0_9NOCA|nr:3-oxosteroid 1-dehydrogenase [Nocardia puris]MBF6210319.1 3-oxosteroid 1-dehydrogenase [Nocardia puris]MBF6367394.1 3-oxosteroid 1-dehydrogenase [Nocardia puris]MBF6457579.1 3-oxosteroid 1-dehydrogenase [Nocardia puris]RBO93742.1 3-oxosteroid 1-dehydrogenase [Nocardia puris]
MSQQQDRAAVYDVVVVGSGAAGMTAALTAAYRGLSVVLIEKSRSFGGSTARSGGGVWIPNNPVLVREGVPDSAELARTYLKAVVGDRVPHAKQDAFLTHGPRMMTYLCARTPHLEFVYDRGYSDYHPERPGGLAQGRSIEPAVIDGRLLGADLALINRPTMSGPKGIAFTVSDFHDLNMIARTWRGKRTALKVGARAVLDRVRGRQPLSLGKALVARLWLALRDAGVPVWLNTPLTELLTEGDAVVGVRAERDGVPITLRARRGVVLAAGGFEHNLALRERFFTGPVSTEWTVGATENVGEGILAGENVGAALDLMDDAWWGPSVRNPDGPPFFCLAERSQPGGLMVNAAGERFTNESASYVDVVHTMYERHATGVGHVPAHFLMDQRFRDRYLFLGTFPRQPIPQKYFDAGIIKKAGTLAELAGLIGVPAATLTATVERFNGFARAGRDEDYGRGESAYDRYYGDPTVRPNPCLAPLEKPPYYAVEMVPGDLGTKGGLVTDEHSRVLRADGAPIAGLYAAGNNSAAVMGNSYAGAGATIGPAMVFGYIAATHLAAHAARAPEDRSGTWAG